MAASSGTTEAARATEPPEPGVPTAAAGAGSGAPGNELADALATEPGVWQRLPWKPILTAVLLGLVAFAVLVVLLQSAGIIDWGFLGPTA